MNFRSLAPFCALLLSSWVLSADQHPAAAVAEANRGVSLAHNAKYREAIEAYRRAISIDPSLPEINLNLGLAFFKLGNFRGAIAAFEKENAKAPSTRAATLLAMSFFGNGQYSEAAQRIKPLVEAQPENTELAYLLAKCYTWSGQTNAALDLFKRLLAVDPNSSAVHMLMGEALDASDRTDEAIQEFEAAAKASPGQPDVHFGLGYLYWKRKQYENAEREFRLELKNNASAKSNGYLGDLLMKTGRKDEAYRYLKSAVQLQPDFHMAHEDLGVLYVEDKQNALAEKEFREAIRSDPSNYDAHYRLARLYREMGRKSDADREFAAVQHLHEKKKEEVPLLQITGPQ